MVHAGVLAIRYGITSKAVTGLLELIRGGATVTEDELKKVARLMLEARIVESIPSKEKITEIVLAEIRRQAYGMYDREARTMSATLVQTEVRAQLKVL